MVQPEKYNIWYVVSPLNAIQIVIVASVQSAGEFSWICSQVHAGI